MEAHLSQADWDALEGPYGPASDVPLLLQALRGGDPASCAQAERALEDHHLQHQGQIYPPGAAAVPYLIALLGEPGAADRLAACRLLQMIVENVDLYAPAATVVMPTLEELASARCDWWVRRSPAWQHAGDDGEPETSAVDAAAYQAARSGLPTYLTLLHDDDRKLRAGVASLLGHFPSEWDAMSAALTSRLSTEDAPDVAAAICLTVGRAGRPSHGPAVQALRRWRQHPDQHLHRCALIGLARVDPAPDPAALAELAGYLIITETIHWQSPQAVLANAAATALGGRHPADLPQLAELLLTGLRTPHDNQDNYLALQLLLGLAFPDGPLPDQARFADLSDLQQNVVRAVVNTGALHRATATQRAIGECNLPAAHHELAAWAADHL